MGLSGFGSWPRDFRSRLIEATGANASSEVAGHGHKGHFAENRLEPSGDWILGGTVLLRCLLLKEPRSVFLCAVHQLWKQRNPAAASFK